MSDPQPPWDTEAFNGAYAGHPGRLYRRSPATLADLIAGTRCWTDREFLVHGPRRITYAQFRGALGHATG